MALRQQGTIRVIIQWCLLLSILVGVSACGVEATQTTQNFTPCMPDGEGVNLYKTGVSGETQSILQQYAGVSGIIPTLAPSASGENSFGTISESQALLTMNSASSQAAFLFLLEETIRASDIKTIKFDNFDEISIIITFLSPALLQAAFLNDFLFDRQSPAEFESKMFSAFAKITKRQELLFLITVTGIHRDALAAPHSVMIPVKKLLLTNTASLPIHPEHDEQNLTQPYYTNQEPESVILGYPIGVMVNNQCVQVLDPVYNTNIVFGVDMIKVDNNDNGPHIWSIPYTSLLETDSSSSPALFNSAAMMIPSKIEPHSSPPQDRNSITFWSDYALFIWYKVTQGNR